MTEEKAPKPDVRFIIHLARDQGTTLSGGEQLYTLSLEPVYIGPDEYGPNKGKLIPLSPRWSDYSGSDPVPELADLAIRAQGEQDATERGWYGHEVSYHRPYRVTERQATSMAKTLRRINGAIRKHCERYGYVTQIETYAAVAAKAAGARTDQPFGIPDDAYDDGYRWMGPDGLRYLLADTLAGKRDDKIPTRDY